MNEWWGFGAVNIKAERGFGLGYLFKYAFKKPLDSDPEEDADHLAVPDWFADYRNPETGQTFFRARFWFTSKKFYTGHKPEQAPKS
ncbi:MAG: hypothetical protein AAF517_16615, partial [Planctomycetota bacterium]